jgi:RNA polymerase sigma-70 factor (ECF subfamily)
MGGLPAQPSLPERVKQDMTGAWAIEHDAELMLRVRDGDVASFALLLERHRTPVIHFLYRMVQNQAVAEELAQEAFLRVYRSRATYEPAARFTTWLFRIAMHLALNWIRDTRNERSQESLDREIVDGAARQTAAREPSVEQRMVRDAELDEVRRAIALLPAKQRAAVLMHKYEELDYSQIARVLGCSESAVKSLLFRAYETLRARLAHFSRGPGKE